MPSIADGDKMAQAQATCNTLEDWGCGDNVPIRSYDYALPPFLQTQGRLKELSSVWRVFWMYCCNDSLNI